MASCFATTYDCKNMVEFETLYPPAGPKKTLARTTKVLNHLTTQDTL